MAAGPRPRCAWDYRDAYGRAVRCDAVEAAPEHDHSACLARGHAEWWGCHPFRSAPRPAVPGVPVPATPA